MANPNMVYQNMTKNPADDQRAFRSKDAADTYHKEMESKGHKVKRTTYKIGPKKNPTIMHNVHVWHKKEVKEEAPANAVGGGHVAGLGVGPQGEPAGISKMKKLWRRYLEVKK